MVCVRVCEQMKSRLLHLRWQLSEFIHANSVGERKCVERGTRRHLVDRVMAPPGHKWSQLNHAGVAGCHKHVTL